MVFWHARDASVQPLAAQLEAMSEEEKAGWQLPEKALRAFHFRAVQRIYGEQGAQVRLGGGRCRARAVPTGAMRWLWKLSCALWLGPAVFLGPARGADALAPAHAPWLLLGADALRTLACLASHAPCCSYLIVLT